MPSPFSVTRQDLRIPCAALCRSVLSSPQTSQHQPHRPSFAHNTPFSPLLPTKHYSIRFCIKHLTAMASNMYNRNDGAANPGQVKLQTKPIATPPTDLA